MIDTPFSALVSLSELDSLIFQKKSRLAVLMSDLLLLETRVSGIKHEIKQELEAEGLKRKELHSLEMDAKDLLAQGKKKEKQLSLIQNPREYSSIEHELQVLQKKREELEERIFVLWEYLEHNEQRLKQKKHDSENQIQLLAQEVQAKRKQQVALEEEMVSDNERRTILILRLLPEWQAKYTALSQQHHNPIVSVVGNACAGCFYPISPNDLAQLARHKVLQCKECFRLLYTV